LIHYFSNFPLFIQLYGIQTSVTNESNKMTTRQWFDKDKKDKQNSFDAMQEVVQLINLENIKNELHLKFFF